jgi:hypothetical protein
MRKPGNRPKPCTWSVSRLNLKAVLSIWHAAPMTYDTAISIAKQNRPELKTNKSSVSQVIHAFKKQMAGCSNEVDPRKYALEDLLSFWRDGYRNTHRMRNKKLSLVCSRSDCKSSSVVAGKHPRALHDDTRKSKKQCGAEVKLQLTTRSRTRNQQLCDDDATGMIAASRCPSSRDKNRLVTSAVNDRDEAGNYCNDRGKDNSGHEAGSSWLPVDFIVDKCLGYTPGIKHKMVLYRCPARLHVILSLMIQQKQLEYVVASFHKHAPHVTSPRSESDGRGTLNKRTLGNRGLTCPSI